jgi:hypothetical protein
MRKGFCDSCQHWQRFSDNNGICRVNAPTAALIMHQSALRLPPQPQVVSFWPQTKDVDWCAKHANVSS